MRRRRRTGVTRRSAALAVLTIAFAASALGETISPAVMGGIVSGISAISPEAGRIARQVQEVHAAATGRGTGPTAVSATKSAPSSAPAAAAASKPGVDLVARAAALEKAKAEYEASKPKWPCCRICPHEKNFPDIDTKFGLLPGEPDTIPSPIPGTDPAPTPEQDNSGVPAAADDDSTFFVEVGEGSEAERPPPKVVMPVRREVPQWGCCNVCPSMSPPFLYAMAREAGFLEEFATLHTLESEARRRRQTPAAGAADDGMTDAERQRARMQPSRPDPSLALPPCCLFCEEKSFTENVYKDVVRIPEGMAPPPTASDNAGNDGEAAEQDDGGIDVFLEEAPAQLGTERGAAAEEEEEEEVPVDETAMDDLDTRFSRAGLIGGIINKVKSVGKKIVSHPIVQKIVKHPIAQKVVGGVKKVWEHVKKHAGKVWGHVKKHAGKVWGHVKRHASNLWGHVKRHASNLWNKAKTVVSSMFGGAVAWATTKPTAAAAPAFKFPDADPIPPAPASKPPALKPAPLPDQCCHRCPRLATEADKRNRFYWPDRNTQLDPDSEFTRTSS